MLQKNAYFIPSSYSRLVARELALQERDLGRLLRGTGLPLSILQPGDTTRLTGEQQLQVLENAQQMSAAADFGLRLGHRLQPASHGPMGYLALSSPDLLTSLEALRDFLPVRIPFVELQLQQEQAWLHCRLKIKLGAIPEVQRILQECFAMVVQSVVETVLGSKLRGGRIELRHHRPRHHRLYRHYLHCPVRFGAASNQFLIPAALARVSNSAGDPAAYALAEAMCRHLLEQVPASSLSVTDRVRRLLLHAQPGGAASEDDVAQSLFISKRTLARRLAAEHTGYRQIREQVLSELAARHLLESRLSVEAVTTLLGYNDSAAFRKAFRRWYGLAPGEFRARSQAAG